MDHQLAIAHAFYPSTLIHTISLSRSPQKPADYSPSLCSWLSLITFTVDLMHNSQSKLMKQISPYYFPAITLQSLAISFRTMALVYLGPHDLTLPNPSTFAIPIFLAPSHPRWPSCHLFKMACPLLPWGGCACCALCPGLHIHCISCRSSSNETSVTLCRKALPSSSSP